MLMGRILFKKFVRGLQKKRLICIYDELITHFTEIINHTTGVCIAKVIISRFNEDADKIKIICNLTANNLELLI